MFLSTTNPVHNVNFISTGNQESSCKKSSFFAKTACFVLSIGAAFQGLSPLEAKVSAAACILSQLRPIQAQNVTMNAYWNIDYGDLQAPSSTPWVLPLIQANPSIPITSYPYVTDYRIRPCVNDLPNGWLIAARGNHPASTIANIYGETIQQTIPKQLNVNWNPSTEVYALNCASVSSEETGLAVSLVSEAQTLALFYQKLDNRGFLSGLQTPLAAKAGFHLLLRSMVSVANGGFVIACDCFPRDELIGGLANLSLTSPQAGNSVYIGKFDKECKPIGQEIILDHATLPSLAVLNNANVVVSYLSTDTGVRKQSLFGPNLLAISTNEERLPEGQSVRAPLDIKLMADIQPSKVGNGYEQVWSQSMYDEMSAFFQRFDAQGKPNSSTSIVRLLNQPVSPKLSVVSEDNKLVMFQSGQGTIVCRVNADGVVEYGCTQVDNRTNFIMYPSIRCNTQKLPKCITSWYQQTNGSTQIVSQEIYPNFGEISSPPQESSEYFSDAEAAGIVMAGITPIVICAIIIAILAKRTINLRREGQTVEQVNDIPRRQTSRSPLIPSDGAEVPNTAPLGSPLDTSLNESVG